MKWNGRFWIQADEGAAREISHKDAIKAVQEGRAVYVKGGMPRLKEMQGAE